MKEIAMKLFRCSLGMLLGGLCLGPVLAKGDNTPPAGFKALSNGIDLTVWKGKQPDWKVVDGVIIYDGKAGDLVTERKDFKDTNKEGLLLIDEQGGSRQTLWACEGARASQLYFSADGRVLLAALTDGTVRAWAVATGRSLVVPETGHDTVRRVTASDDLSVLATLGDNDCVKVWECKLP